MYSLLLFQFCEQILELVLRLYPSRCGSTQTALTKIASRRSDPPIRRDAYFLRTNQHFKSKFRAKKMASAAPGIRPDPFRMNSNAPEPARSPLVDHPPINASSIALTRINMHPHPDRNNHSFRLTHRQGFLSGDNQTNIQGITAYQSVWTDYVNRQA